MLKYLTKLISLFLYIYTYGQVNGTTGLPIGGIGTGAIKFNGHQGTFAASFKTPTRNGDYSPLQDARFQIFTKRGTNIITKDTLKAILKDGYSDDDAIFPKLLIHLSQITILLCRYLPPC